MAIFRRSKTRPRGSRTLTIPDLISYSHDRSGSNIWSRWPNSNAAGLARCTGLSRLTNSDSSRRSLTVTRELSPSGFNGPSCHAR